MKNLKNVENASFSLPAVEKRSRPRRFLLAAAKGVAVVAFTGCSGGGKYGSPEPRYPDTESADVQRLEDDAQAFDTASDDTVLNDIALNDIALNDIALNDIAALPVDSTETSDTAAAIASDANGTSK